MPSYFAGRVAIVAVALVASVGCGKERVADSGSSCDGFGFSAAPCDAGKIPPPPEGGLLALPDTGLIPPKDPSCPRVVPVDGSRCTPPGLCSYIAGSHQRCVVGAYCESTSSGAPFAWHLALPSARCGANAPTCPASYAELAAGAACPDTRDQRCDYPEGRCGCAGCSEGYTWECRAWNDVAAGCPSEAPLVGTPCSNRALQCEYTQTCGEISLGESVTCNGYTWEHEQTAAGNCAIRTCGR